jgi:transcriptional regulator with XRE-family HTH domain/DNA-directed RNA polymerase subunit RPC12/RpoP
MLPQGESFERIGHRVRQLRTDRGWTQKELAAHANLSSGYIANLEWAKGIRRPRLEKLKAIAAALGIAYEELMQTTKSESLSAARLWCANVDCPAVSVERYDRFAIRELIVSAGESLRPERYLPEMRLATFPPLSNGAPNRFCPYCAHELISACSRCGRLVESGEELYCRGCGGSLLYSARDAKVVSLRG